MTAIITGDIINSRKLDSGFWMEGLKKILNTKGKNPIDWEIFRGDEFQLEIGNPEDALFAAIEIKTWLKTIRLDARISIGIGEKTFSGKKISESNGPAFIRSGALFETLKKQKLTLAIHTGNADFDEQMNLLFKLGTCLMQGWLPQSAEFVLTAMKNPGYSQEEIGQQLGITQAAVSRRQKRSQFELIMEIERFYRQQLQKTTL
ncbi:MAG: hypothetical protein CFE23_14690 [Flavobacterium sp. BFFFF1]|uniref:SatD family protein n=1 Tax=unclassified Flavobacterium TaxID=196869 RepID=UPI000BDABBEB|nr:MULTISPECIES: SatD family protein [unclassified Flavobacterium]OYU79292.1 MAG: hypothetical protein CFE23_14690 [Flavobacterium sp. BFFFF1]